MKNAMEIFSCTLIYFDDYMVFAISWGILSTLLLFLLTSIFEFQLKELHKPIIAVVCSVLVNL